MENEKKLIENLKNKKIFVAGHNGMVGSAAVRNLKKNGFENLVLRTREELDLTKQVDVERFFEIEKPEVVIIAAAKVGGIHANNTYRAEFIYQNLIIELNIINSSYICGVDKLIFLGSSCIYPKFSEQPIKEEAILAGKLEFTNEPYSIAKIAGIKLCENYYRQYRSNFFAIMPTNLYGSNDNFNIDNSHVIPALIRRMHDAKIENKKEFIVWGTGKPTREFLFVDDLADAIHFAVSNLNACDVYSRGFSQINIGTGNETSIKELTDIVKEVIGYKGEIIYDNTKPDGMPRRVLDVSLIRDMGWEHKTSLKDGITQTYGWFLNNLNKLRK